MRYYSFILVLIFLFLYPLHLQAQSDCEVALNEVLDSYEVLKKGNQFYMRYTMASTKDGIDSRVLTSEINCSGDKVRYENLFVTFLQDANTRVSIMKENKIIIIQDVPKGETKPLPTLSRKSQIDSLRKVSTSIGCKKEGTKTSIVFMFPEKQKYAYLPYRSIVLAFDNEQKKLLYGHYTYCSDSGNYSEVYTYDELKNENNKETNLSPLDEIFRNAKLKKEYSEYQVKDIRKK